MRTRSLCVLAAAIWLALPSVPVQAQGNLLSAIGRGIARDVKRRLCWPRPFNVQDRYAVRAPFAAMVAKGWEHQNLLGAHHFDEGTNQLNEAGRLKLAAIVNESPPQHRIVYVQRGSGPDCRPTGQCPSTGRGIGLSGGCSAGGAKRCSAARLALATGGFNRPEVCGQLARSGAARAPG